MAAIMEGMQGKMDYEISKLADSAVIGNKEGLDKLIAIAESSFAENPGRSAEAYRGVAAAYKQQMVELSFESRESKGKIARLEQFKSYVETHKHLLEVKTVLSGPSPTFAEFSQRLEFFPNDAMTILWFVSCLPETDSLLKLLENAQVTENWATVFTIVKPLAFSWVVSHFSAPPTDEESRKVLSEVSHCFDPNRVTVLSDLVGLWPLLQLFEQKEQ